MRWITDDWRLKLLALGLAVLMLGAVAFAQNPPTTRTLSVSLGVSQPVNPGFVIINPPQKINVTITGLGDTLATVTSSNLSAIADATHITSPGPDVKLNIAATSTIKGVNVVTPAPIDVDVDVLTTVEVPLSISAQGATGWNVTKKVPLCPGSTVPCKVHFTGPKQWTVGLKGVVNIPQAINATNPTFFNQPIVLLTNSGPIDTAKTTPQSGLDYPSVDISIEAQTGVTSTTVPLVDAPPSHGPPPGYRVVGITYSPNTVIITGDQSILRNIQRITLPAVDLSTSTSTATFRIQIPYPNGVTSPAGVTTVSITYQIAPNPNVTPSP